jgi:hypothetical protein
MDARKKIYLYLRPTTYIYFLHYTKKISIPLVKAARKETPLNKQYNQIKAKYPGALLLFRVGDFYETFGEDAIRA